MATTYETLLQGTDAASVDDMIAQLRRTLAQRDGRILHIIKWRDRDAPPFRAEISYAIDGGPVHWTACAQSDAPPG